MTGNLQKIFKVIESAAHKRRRRGGRGNRPTAWKLFG